MVILQRSPIIIFSYILSVMLIIGVVVGLVWYWSARPSVLEIYIFSLKGGQSYLVRTPDDQRILIDGGANSEIVRKLSKALPFYSRRIDKVLLTGDDPRKAFGLIDILGRYDVGQAILSEVSYSDAGIATTSGNFLFLEATKKNNIETTRTSAGKSISLGAGVSLNILFPILLGDFSYSKASPPDIFFEIAFRGKRMLFLGNATKKIQKHIFDRGPNVHDERYMYRPDRIDMLVVSTSASDKDLDHEIVNTLRPRYLIYSSTKKKPERILPFILSQNRFNTKETPSLRVVVDDTRISVEEI